jgi:hypothetical protein
LAASAGTAATVVLAPISAQTAQKASKLIANGTRKIGGSIGNLSKLSTGINGIADNANLLTKYNEQITNRLTSFSTSLGGWNSELPTFIQSIGTYGQTGLYATKTEELQGYIVSDMGSINQEQVELKTPKFTFGI